VGVVNGFLKRAELNLRLALLIKAIAEKENTSK